MLDATDRSIIEATQARWPLATVPYAENGAAHGLGDRAEIARNRALIADLLGPHYRRSDILYATRTLKKNGLRLKTKGA